jgi:hypothetical protein
VVLRDGWPVSHRHHRCRRKPFRQDLVDPLLHELVDRGGGVVHEDPIGLVEQHASDGQVLLLVRRQLLLPLRRLVELVLQPVQIQEPQRLMNRLVGKRVSCHWIRHDVTQGADGQIRALCEEQRARQRGHLDTPGAEGPDPGNGPKQGCLAGTHRPEHRDAVPSGHRRVHRLKEHAPVGKLEAQVRQSRHRQGEKHAAFSGGGRRPVDPREAPEIVNEAAAEEGLRMRGQHRNPLSPRPPPACVRPAFHQSPQAGSSYRTAARNTTPKRPRCWPSLGHGVSARADARIPNCRFAFRHARSLQAGIQAGRRGW